MKKTIATLLLTSVILSALFGITANAEKDEPSYYDGTVSTTWGYTAGTTIYHITNASELAAFAAAVDDGATFAGCTVYLDCDIVWNDGVASETGFVLNDPEGTLNEWNPIGLSTSSVEEPSVDEPYFCGAFNGLGHTVSGLYYNNESDGKMVGFFSVFHGSYLGNLNIVNSYFSSLRYTGSFTGCVHVCTTGEKNVILENLYSDAIIKVSKTEASGDATRSGGIAGPVRCSVWGSVTIKQCWFDGAVLAGASSDAVGGGIGGITATAFGNAGSAGTVANYQITYENCLNTGKITGWKKVGGITGQVYKATVTIKNCISMLDGASLASPDSAGGIVGQITNSNFNNLSIEKSCYKPITGKIQNVIFSGSVNPDKSIRAIDGTDYSSKTMADLDSDIVCRVSTVDAIVKANYDENIWQFDDETVSIKKAVSVDGGIISDKLTIQSASTNAAIVAGTLEALYDGNNATGFSGSGAQAYILLTLKEESAISELGFMPYGSDSQYLNVLAGAKIEVSPDNAAWTEVCTLPADAVMTAGEFYDVESSLSEKYLYIKITFADGKEPALAEIEARLVPGEETITIVPNTHLIDTASKLSTNAKVFTGSLSAVFDGNTATGFECGGDGRVYIQCKFVEPTIIKAVSFFPAGSEWSWRWIAEGSKILASKDGTEWDTLYTFPQKTVDDQDYGFADGTYTTADISSTEYYSYFRYQFDNNARSAINEILISGFGESEEQIGMADITPNSTLLDVTTVDYFTTDALTAKGSVLNLFDGNTQTGYLCETSGEIYVGCKFSKPTRVTGVKLYTYGMDDTYRTLIRNAEVLVSDDGENWTSVAKVPEKTSLGYPYMLAKDDYSEIGISDEGFHTYLRLKFNSATVAALSELLVLGYDEEHIPEPTPDDTGNIQDTESPDTPETTSPTQSQEEEKKGCGSSLGGAVYITVLMCTVAIPLCVSGKKKSAAKSGKFD